MGNNHNQLSLTGQRFGRLVAIGPTPHRSTNREVLWLCRCDCGTTIERVGRNLKRGTAKSCGCLQKEIVADLAKTNNRTHGHTTLGRRSGTYSAWSEMIARCTNPKKKMFRYYGGRGVKVCDRWLNSFENFLADMGARPPGRNHTGKRSFYSLDRIINNGNYEPGNCRWATWKEQCANRRPQWNARQSLRRS